MIYPYANKYVREMRKKKDFSYLFYGPQGSGKSLMVRAIASETRSLVFDYSPGPIVALGDKKT